MMRSRLNRWAPPIVAALVLAIALVALHHELRTYTLPQILESVQRIPLPRLLLALLFTGLSYLTLTGYDWMAVRYVGAGIRYRQAALAAFVGYAFSQALGFPLVTGAPPRYRLYTLWGVEAPDIARIVAFYSSTFWVGFLTVSGVAFLVEPPALPGPLAALVPTARPLGALFLLIVTGYVVWSWRGGPGLRIRRWTLDAPALSTALRQVVIASADWLAAALTLFVLVSGEVHIAFGVFLGTFLLAQIIGVFSQVPGGLGVFEVTLLLALPAQADNRALIAALVAYRAVYYLVPLVLAAASLGIFELQRRRHALSQAMELLGPAVSTAVPVVLAGTVFVAGGLLLATGAIPSRGTLSWLGTAPPLLLLEASHFLSSLVGASLLILAWGLARRLDGAFHAALALLGLGAVLSAMRPGGLAASMVLLLVLLALAPAQREFFRRSALLAEPLSPEWIFGVGAVLLTTAWLGFFAYREVDYSHDLWWRFAMNADAPRFLRASVGAGVVILAFAIARLLRPPEPDEAATPQRIPEEVEHLVAESPRTTAWLAFLGDKSFLFSTERSAFLMFAVERRSWVAMGDPVGDPAAFPELVWAFRDRALRHGGWPVFYQVRPEFLPLYVDAGLTLIKLGEEALVPTGSFSMEGGKRSGFRRTLRKIEKEGGSFEMIPVEGTHAVLQRLREISDAWRAAKSIHEKGFSLGAFSEEYVARFPVAVLRREGRIVAFVNVWPGAPGEEFSVDLMRYHPHEAPTDAMEYLFLKMILWGKENGYRSFSLGMAPLSGLEGGPLAPLWARMGGAVYRYGEHFYNFQGLRAYKDKFDPVWEPRYMASPGGLAIPRVLGNVAALISGSLRGALAR
jgi:phosphatidylglycerol lysyltransferase